MSDWFEARLREDIERIERALEESIPTEQTPYSAVTEAMRYSLLGGGKRIRGVMLLEFYRLFASDIELALPFAVAIEMVHAYSLIHDDLPCMDDDDLRRGKPACHIAFGESTALLAGDGLLTLAFETAAGSAFPPEKILRALHCLAKAAGAEGMIAGQVMDLAGEGHRLTPEELDAINARKTGALFCACAGMGCALAGADPQATTAACAYTAAVGLAFQIVDDILDVTADQGQLGKPVGSDAENEKNTYAALCGVEACRARVAALNGDAAAALGDIQADTRFLEELADRLTRRDF